MAKHIQLKIAEPCHEDWGKMTKSEKGKFCGSCQKQVIDFTGMTDGQLAAFFKKKSAENVCGRFYGDQLDRGIEIPRKRIPWVKYFFQFTLPLLLASCKLKAQQGKVMVETIKEPTCSNNVVLGGISSEKVTLNKDIISREKLISQFNLPVFNEGRLIKGTIIDHEGKPVPYATIDRGVKGIAADSTGSFSIPVPSISDGLKLNVSSVGYESKEILLTNEEINSGKPVVITLSPNIMMGDVEVTSFQNSKIVAMMGAISIVSHKVEPETEVLTPPESDPGFKIYANPAKANTSVFINAGETETGSYAVQLLNLSGQLIKQEQARIEKGMGAISFSIPAIPSGTYLVVLLNNKTKNRVSQKLIVQ